MKVTTFNLSDATWYPVGEPPISGVYDAVFQVPVLSAYAHLNHNVDIHSNEIKGSFGSEHAMRSIYSTIKDDLVTVRNVSHIYKLFDFSGILTVYYSGIIDYGLLFPHVKKKELKVRLGQFAEEAESAFESQSWMSYVLMVGAIVEGILYDKLEYKNFNKLISTARAIGIITDAEVGQMDEVRRLRNRIHPNKYSEPFANRKIAMELSVTYNRLIKRNWYADEQE